MSLSNFKIIDKVMPFVTADDAAGLMRRIYKNPEVDERIRDLLLQETILNDCEGAAGALLTIGTSKVAREEALGEYCRSRQGFMVAARIVDRGVDLQVRDAALAIIKQNFFEVTPLFRNPKTFAGDFQRAREMWARIMAAEENLLQGATFEEGPGRTGSRFLRIFQISAAEKRERLIMQQRFPLHTALGLAAREFLPEIEPPPGVLKRLTGLIRRSSARPDPEI